MRSPRRVSFAALLLVLLARPAGTASGDGGGAAALVEKEFSNAIKIVTPATVFCVPKGVPVSELDGSSGVLITRSGYVLSDGDVGLVSMKGGVKQFAPVVEVRVPDPKKSTFQVFTAKVALRVAEIDSCLLKIENPPSSGFPFVLPRTADDLKIGSFTFAMGTPFGHAEGGSASLTAGVVSALVRSPEGDPAGRNSEVYTSAAVNPGINGGPLVDAEGTLVGIISTWGQPEPKNPFQFLGKAFPIDRIRAAYRGLSDFAAIFPDPKTLPRRSKQSDLLEVAFAFAAKKAFPSVVSLDLTRKNPFFMEIPTANGVARLQRYAGAVTGVLATADGAIVTSLYNLGNTTFIANSMGAGDLERTIGDLASVTAHLPDGQSLPARLVSYDLRLGIAVLKVDFPAGYVATPIESAPADEGRVGRLVVCVGNPFGASKTGDPFVTVGMLSRFHPTDSEEAWRGDFQTDAGITDANCGGAIVDVHGRILGLATLWDPAKHGRSSGIGFGVPWSRILEVLPAMERGRSVRSGLLGVKWKEIREGSAPLIEGIVANSAAERAGIAGGDLVTAIDGKETKTFADVVVALRRKFEGEPIKVVIARDGKPLEFDLVLGARTDD